MAKKLSTIGSSSILNSVLSEDNKHIVVASLDGISLHNILSLEKEFFYETDATPIKVSISPKNIYVAYSTEDAQIYILNLETKNNTLLVSHKEIPISEFDDDNVANIIIPQSLKSDFRSIVFSPNEKILATAGHSTILLKNRIFSKMTFEDAIEYKRTLSDFSIIVWDILQYKPKHILTLKSRENNNIIGLTFSKDSKYLISWDGTYGPFLWDMENGNLIRDFDHRGNHYLGHAEFSADGKSIVSEGSDKYTSSNISTGNINQEYYIGPKEMPDWVKQIFYPRIEKEKTLEKTNLKLIEYSLPVKDIAFSPDNKYIFSGCHESHINVWDINSAKLIKTFEFPIELNVNKDLITDFKISPNGLLLAVFSYGKLFIWNIKSGVNIMRMNCDSRASIEFSRNNKYLAIGGMNKKLQVYSVDKDELIKCWESAEFFTHHFVMTNDNNCICFSRNGNYLASGSSEGNIIIWNTINGKILRTEHFEKEPSEYRFSKISIIKYLSFIQDDKILFVRADDDLYVIDIKTGKRNVFDKDNKIRLYEDKIVVSSKASYLGSASDSELEVWNLISLTKIKQIIKHTKRTNCISFSADETMFASGGEDGLINIWKL